jgi:hypothetical protein
MLFCWQFFSILWNFKKINIMWQIPPFLDRICQEIFFWLKNCQKSPQLFKILKGAWVPLDSVQTHISSLNPHVMCAHA